MNPTMAMDNENVRGFRPAVIAAGGILTGVGVLTLLDRADLAHVHPGRLVPALFLILLGALTMIEKSTIVIGRVPGRDELRRIRHRRHVGSGLWLVAIGSWMLVSELHLFGLTYHTSWPLLIVVLGVSIIIRGWR
jgi:cell wall-active antibiotic response 4TMS protein YvqF